MDRQSLLVAIGLTFAVVVPGHAAETPPTMSTTLLAPSVALTSTAIEPGAAATATALSDAERLARAETELARMKRERARQEQQPAWWEYTCLGCVSAITLLLIITGLVL